jgi:hypothetical protein
MYPGAYVGIARGPLKDSMTFSFGVRPPGVRWMQQIVVAHPDEPVRQLAVAA